LPPLRGEDKSLSLRRQYDALVKQSEQARQDYSKASGEAKTDEERQQAYKEYEAQTSRIAAGILVLAEKAPRDAVAIDALIKVFALHCSEREKKKAAALLLRDHLRSDKIAPICQSLAMRFDDASETLLRTILAKNPNRSIRAEASFALAQTLAFRLSSSKRADAELHKYDVDALGSDVAKTWSEFGEKYSADIPEERLRRACTGLNYTRTYEVEAAMRTLEKDKRRAVQGIACLTLGQVLKRRADALAEKDAKGATQLRDESAQALTRAADKYGEVKIVFGDEIFGGLVGDKAKRELYELRHLSVGMKAPEIDGEDQEGKKLKLSDYRGKVVLLDFWSQF
jgi:hypothetical protein